jgi:putative SOS response-associated peptidase YedK
MCGRYYRRSDKQRLAEAFRLGKLPDGFVLPPDFNVAPTTFQPVVVNNRETAERELTPMRWGMVPFFAKSAADYDRWLSRDEGERPPLDLLRPFEAAAMEAHPVDPRVGNVKHNEPGLCEAFVCPPNSA